jgi:hypothetical protein
MCILRSLLPPIFRNRNVVVCLDEKVAIRIDLQSCDDGDVLAAAALAGGVIESVIIVMLNVSR